MLFRSPSGATSALPFTPAAHEGTSPPGPPPRFQLPGALCGGALGGYFPQSTLCVIEVIIIAPKVVVNSFFFPLPKNRKNNTKKVFREVHNSKHFFDCVSIAPTGVFITSYSDVPPKTKAFSRKNFASQRCSQLCTTVNAQRPFPQAESQGREQGG